MGKKSINLSIDEQIFRAEPVLFGPAFCYEQINNKCDRDLRLQGLFRDMETTSIFCAFKELKYLNFPYLSVPGIDGGALTDSSLTDSYFSTSFIGVNGFGSPVETKYPLMQVSLCGTKQ